MKIRFLHSLKDNIQIGEREMRGITEEQITKYEEQLELRFPKAYKEFLFLAGEYPGSLKLLDGVSTIEDLVDKEFKEYFKEDFLDLFNFNEVRPYWVFTQGAQAFFFMYLDENDEDPMVHRVEFFKIGEYEQTTTGSTFSEFINDLVDYSIESYKAFYG